MLWLLLFISGFGLASASIQTTSQAACTSLDLRSEHLLEIRNQKKVAWCYAFTAADLLAHTFNLSTKISAADVAINHNQSFIGRGIRRVRDITRNRNTQSAQENFMMAHQTGFTKVAMNRVMREGYCEEATFPSEQWIKVVRAGSIWHEVPVDLKPAMLEIFDLLKTKDQLTVGNIPFYFKFKNLESPEDFLNLLGKSNRKNFYSNLRATVCKNSYTDFAQQWKVKMQFRGRNLFKKVNAQLELGRVVSLDYDNRALKDKNNSKISLSKLHTSLLVARKWNDQNNSCDYLVRDSYGDKCTGYDSSYECLGGQVWIPETTLLRSAVSIVYLLSPPAHHEELRSAGF